MPDDPAFIRAIAASPDDDAPRLVYADYLDETGDPAKAARAEFIRVQIEKARLVPDTPRWTELWHRDTALLEWATQWRAELPRIVGVQYGGFARGFVDKVESYTPIAFLSSASKVFDCVPVFRLSVRALSAEQAIQLVRFEGLCATSNLELSVRELTVDTMAALSDRGPWPNLRRIRVQSTSLQRSSQLGSSIERLRTVFGDRLALNILDPN
jgi:uncharacterized protein (TIGR02996 family)